MFNIFLNKETKYLFTVVIHSSGGAAKLLRAVKSVLWQTCQDYECFVLDDGSDDNTREIFAELSEQKRLRLLRFPAGHGKAYCFNYAIIRSSGRFMTFLETSDIWLPARLEEFEKAIQERPETGFWFSNSFIWRGKSAAGLGFSPEESVAEGAVPGYRVMGEDRLPYMVSNTAVEREAFNRAGLFLGQLRELPVEEGFARILASGTLSGVIKAPLAVCGVSEGNDSVDYELLMEEAETVLKSGRTPPEIERSSVEWLVRKTAAELIESGKTHYAREFLKRHCAKRDFSFFLLLVAAFFPGIFSRMLRGYAARKPAPVRGGHAAGLPHVEALVRSIS